jgi:hypothetical protein
MFIAFIGVQRDGVIIDLLVQNLFIHDNEIKSTETELYMCHIKKSIPSKLCMESETLVIIVYSKIWHSCIIFSVGCKAGDYLLQ